MYPIVSYYFIKEETEKLLRFGTTCRLLLNSIISILMYFLIKNEIRYDDNFFP